MPGSGLGLLLFPSFSSAPQLDSNLRKTARKGTLESTSVNLKRRLTALACGKPRHGRCGRKTPPDRETSRLAAVPFDGTARKLCEATNERMHDSSGCVSRPRVIPRYPPAFTLIELLVV